MNDFAGKVVLVETMAMWCPNCVGQANEVRNQHNLLGNPDGLEWHFAVAQLEVARALGNLYSAQYLNPPLSPMLIIDRDGNVHQLEYGLKKAEALQEVIEPYLKP